MDTTRTLRGSVLTFGEPLVSMVPNRKGTLSLNHQFAPYIGGAELNTAIGLARLGVYAAYAGVVGDDAFGQMIRSTLRSEGINDRYLEVAHQASTGIYFKQWSGLRRDPSVYYYRSESPMAKGSWLASSLLRDFPNVATEIGGSDGAAHAWNWVHTTGITLMIGKASQDLALKLLRKARASSTPVSLDVNVRLKLGTVDEWKNCIRNALSSIDWLILGSEEAIQLFGTVECHELEKSVRREGFSGTGVLLKRGTQGAEASCHGDVTTVPAIPVEHVVDTVGAGDGFNAGWIAGMTSGWSLSDALRLGAVVGAFAVTTEGDADAYPRNTEAMAEFYGFEEVRR